MTNPSRSSHSVQPIMSYFPYKATITLACFDLHVFWRTISTARLRRFKRQSKPTPPTGSTSYPRPPLSRSLHRQPHLCLRRHPHMRHLLPQLRLCMRPHLSQQLTQLLPCLLHSLLVGSSCIHDECACCERDFVMGCFQFIACLIVLYTGSESSAEPSAWW